MKNKEIMKKKNLWGLLAVLFVAVFAFAACSDDDDDKTGTYEYQVINSFDGSIESINKVNDAFKQAFGAESAPFTLSGTKSECNRKAKEYAMKAQAALANDGSFSADIKLVNTTTNELIHSFGIQKDENLSYGKKIIQLHYELDKKGITITGAKGNRVKIERNKPVEISAVAFDAVIETDKQTINLTRIFKNSNGEYLFTMYEGTSEKELCSFYFYFNKEYEVGDVPISEYH